MPALQARAWCFTQNNPEEYLDWTPEEGQNLPMHPKMRYCIYQYEKVTTPHLQGYVELTAPCSERSMHQWLPNASFFVRKGTREQAKEYCEKEDDSWLAGPWEHGSFGKGGSGARNDLHDAIETLKAEGLKRVAELHPAVFVRNVRGLRELVKELETPPSDADFKPRPWQTRLLALLEKPPCDRKIIWVYDEAGNRGKSRLATHLIAEHGAITLAGKICDMAYAYNKHPIVLFDITRKQADFSSHLYSFAENLKNGVIFSTKYESCVKIFKAPHVVFFANTKPEENVWTADRLLLLDLSEDRWHSPHFLPRLATDPAPEPGNPPTQAAEDQQDHEALEFL